MRSDLRWNLMIRMVVVIFAVLIINFAINAFFFYEQFSTRIKVQAEALGKDIVDEVHQSLSVLEADEQIFAMFNFNLERLVKEREYLVETALLSPKGKFLSHGDPNMVGKQAPDDLMKYISNHTEDMKPLSRADSYAVVLPIQGSEGETAVYLLLGFDKKLFTEPMKQIVFWLALIMAGSIVAMAIVMNFFAVGALTKPLNSLAVQSQTVADGDLTREVPTEGIGEIRLLAKAFNHMTMSLKEVLLKIMHTSNQFTETCQKLFMLSGEINHGSQLQMSTLNEASDSVKQMESNVEDIAAKVVELNHLSQNTSTSILQMAASISEVDANVENLASMVDEISSSILEINHSAKEVAAGAESVASEAEATASSTAQINASLEQVDASTSLSANLSTQVAEVAEEGMHAIGRTLEGMKAIREAVEATSRNIDRLGERSNRIGKILGVINKIAEETNLLALNAAIIAAEAGEHGRGFDVVANEIQTLAERTTLQTKEIDTLIRDVQRETMASIQQAKTVLQRVEEGEALTSGTADVLIKIKNASKDSQEMIQKIAKASQEQTTGLRRVAEASDRVSGEVAQISKATREQANGTTRIMEAIERIKDLARAVQHATREQTDGSKSISRATEQVRELVTNINSLTEGHRTDAGNVSSIVTRNLQIIEENVRRVQDMESGVEALINLTSSLNDEIGKFQFSEEEKNNQAINMGTGDSTP